MKYLLITVLFLYTNIFTATYKTYNTSDNFGTLYDGVGRDWKGNIYIGAGRKSDFNAAVFKFNFSTDRLEKVAEVKAASQSVSNWFSNDYAGKIHTSIKQGIDGKMYFGSHRSEGDVAYAPGFRGGHFYSYDPATGSTVDLSAPGVGSPGQGLMDIALGLQYGYVYGVDESSKLYRQDINTHESHYIWDSGSETRNIFSDNRGRLYSPTNFGRLLIYDPAQDTFWVARAYNPLFMSTCKRIPAVVKSASGDTIYFIGKTGTGNPNHIWRFIPDQDTVEDLGLVNPSNQAAASFSLALRWDLNKLYFAVGSTLYSLNVITRARATEASGFSYGGQALSGSNGVDKDGNIWFTKKTNTAGQVIMFDLNIPCAVCTQKLPYVDSAYVTAGIDELAVRLENKLLFKIHPNPMNAFAEFSLNTGRMGNVGPVNLAVYTPDGKLVKSWDLGSRHKERKVVWHGKNSSGMFVSNGIYIARLRAADRVQNRVLILMR